MLNVRIAGVCIAFLVGVLLLLHRGDETGLLVLIPAGVSAAAFAIGAIVPAHGRTARWRLAGLAIAMAGAILGGGVAIAVIRATEHAVPIAMIGAAALVHALWAVRSARRRYRKRLFDNYLTEDRGAG